MTNHDYHAEVDAASAARSVISFIGVHQYGGSVTVEDVTVEQTNNADADFNIELGGDDIFNSEQSVDAADTIETLTPDQNKSAAGENLDLAVDVSTAAGNAADQLLVTVTVDDGKGD